MQKISFGNRDYVKASLVAKQFRYTQDYVGQLCRGKKVDAHLVGRTWYVEPDSVVAYRQTKHTAQKATAAELSTHTKRNLNPKPITAVVRAKTVKSTQHPALYDAPRKSVTYSPDKGVTIPIVSFVKNTPVSSLLINKPILTTNCSVHQAPAKKIKIKPVGTLKTQYRTEKLPEIMLSGKLKVHVTTDEIELKQPPKLATTNSAEVGQSRVAADSIYPNPGRTINASSERTVSTRSIVMASRPRAGAPLSSPTASFTPNQVSTLPTVSRPHFLHSDGFLVTSLVVGVVSALVILSLASLGEVSATSNRSWTLFFDLENLLRFWL